LTALGNACAAAITGAISLGPASATNDVGTTHTVTATLRDANNNPIVGAVVSFNVVTGPNAASPGTCSVNANCTSDGGGQVSFTYLGDGGPGTDTIEACFTDASGARRCARATKSGCSAPRSPSTTCRCSRVTRALRRRCSPCR
ncbi:MAG: Ig-like domain-containing protein, partial [Acidimicrobiales bacterium]